MSDDRPDYTTVEDLKLQNPRRPVGAIKFSAASVRYRPFSNDSTEIAYLVLFTDNFEASYRVTADEIKELRDWCNRMLAVRDSAS